MTPLRCAGLAILTATALPAAAQTPTQDVPTIDTEDATLGSATVRAGRFQPIVTLDVRNGDYARGAYDDDDADLSRVPVHAALGFAAVLRRDAGGDGSLFLIGQSSNGFHSPAADERVSPRAWYESNSIVALAWRPVAGLTTGAAYAIKVSPNGVSATTHEVSVSANYATHSGWGRWKPGAVITTRTQGGGGVFTLIGVTPDVALGDATLSFPVVAGIGWNGFYASGSGNRHYASIGTALEKDVSRNATLRAELLALVRDRGLRALDAPNGTTAAVVPLATLALVVHW